MRESAARYRSCRSRPEAIVVLDVDSGASSTRTTRRRSSLSSIERGSAGGAGDLESTATARRRPSEERARAYIQQALEGNTPVF